MTDTRKRAPAPATVAFAGMVALAPTGAGAEQPAHVAPFPAIRTAIQQGLTSFQKQHNFKADPADAAMFQALQQRYTQALNTLPQAGDAVVFGVGITANDGITTMEQWGVKLNQDGSAEVVVRPTEMDPKKRQQDRGCVVSDLTAGSCFQVYHAAKVDAQGRISPLDPASYSLVPFGVRDGDRVTPFQTAPRPATTAEALNPPTGEQPDTVGSVREKILADLLSPPPAPARKPPEKPPGTSP